MAIQKNNIIPRVRHSGSVMIWGCSIFSLPVFFNHIFPTMNMHKLWAHVTTGQHKSNRDLMTFWLNLFCSNLLSDEPAPISYFPPASGPVTALGSFGFGWRIACCCIMASVSPVSPIRFSLFPAFNTQGRIQGYSGNINLCVKSLHRPAWHDEDP